MIKSLATLGLALVIAALPMAASPASADKLLQNVRGSVTYGATSTPTNSLAPNANVALNDNDYAATGAASQAAITLPDSSRVLIGAASNVQLVSFDGAAATAKLVVVGKVRFTVEHPSGAAANYTFQTATGTISVRGTVGDISANQAGLQVNVYSLSNPALPVQVTLTNGQVFTLSAGQSLVATAAAGSLSASVTTLSHTLYQPFTEFGEPANASALGIAPSGAASATAATAAAIGAAAAAVVVIGNNNKTGPAPAQTPSVSLGVNAQPREGGARSGDPAVPHAPSVMRTPKP